MSVRKALLSGCLLLSLSLAAQAAAMKSIIGDQVNVRSGPGKKHEVLFKANLGYPIQVEQQQGDWVRFKDWLGERGWVTKDMVGNVSTVVVLGTDANVRRGPAASEAAVTKVQRGEIYRVLARKGGWIKLGYYEDSHEVGWIREDLVWGH